jgi:hypothetical protein
MIWGSISGQKETGPMVSDIIHFFEKFYLFLFDSVIMGKGLGKVTKELYCQHIVPVIKRKLELFVGGILIDDNAPGHAAKITREKL